MDDPVTGGVTGGPTGVVLRLRERTAADPARGWVPALLFDIVTDAGTVGDIQLRLGNTDALRRYGGHVGYHVIPCHRGHGHAAAALRSLLPVAADHGFAALWISYSPDNVASRRTLERAGAVLKEIVRVPAGGDLYRRGVREACRYRLGITR